MKRSSNLMASCLFIALVLAIQGGCAGTAKVTKPVAQTAPEKKIDTKKIDTKHVVFDESILAGKVMETMSAKGYTYIRLEKNGKQSWVAVPAVAVAVGQDVKVRPGTEMGQFTSKTLDRTFDNIVFSPGLVNGASAQLPKGHPDISAATKPAGNEAMPEAAPAPVKLSGKIVEMHNAGGYTYLCLEKDGKKSWAAVPATKVNLGDQVELQPGMAMRNFRSKTLDRTFDSIIFSQGIVPVKSGS
jgi:hypothetical protein